MGNSNSKILNGCISETVRQSNMMLKDNIAQEVKPDNMDDPLGPALVKHKIQKLNVVRRQCLLISIDLEAAFDVM